jgi:hypothetical protein
MTQDHFTFMAAGTLDEPSKLEVRKDGRAIGRILHVGSIFEFHPGMTSFALNAAASTATSKNSRNGFGETQSPEVSLG